MADGADLKTLVLLDAGLATLRYGLDLEAVQHWLEKAIPAVRVQRVPDLHQCTGECRAAMAASGTARLVLGLCAEEYATAALQDQAKKAGLDPLGMEVVNLGAAAALIHPRPLATEQAKILLAAAVAQARAFTGSHPEHARLSFPTSVSRRSLFTLPLPQYQAAPAIVEPLCAADLGCTACVQVCPQAALTWSEGRIHYDKGRCEPCGLCVTACPRGAVRNPAITPAQLAAQIRVLLDPSLGNLQPRGVVFTCQRAPAPEGPWHAGWMPVRLPCVGMAPVAWFLAPLLLGASAVGVLPCRAGCPIGQDEVIAGRVAYCQAFLRLLKAPVQRVTLSPALDRPPPGAGTRMAVAAPFDPTATAEVLRRLAQAYQAPSGLALAHPYAPLGVIEIREDVCTGCGMCAMSCPTQALDYTPQEESVALTFDAARCVACGQCLPRCPEASSSAIALSRSTDLGRLEQGRTLIYQEGMARCVGCGAPVAPYQMLRRIEALLGSEHAATLPVLTRYCTDCRSTVAFQTPGK